MLGFFVVAAFFLFLCNLVFFKLPAPEVYGQSGTCATGCNKVTAECLPDTGKTYDYCLSKDALGNCIICCSGCPRIDPTTGTTADPLEVRDCMDFLGCTS